MKKSQRNIQIDNTLSRLFSTSIVRKLLSGEKTPLVHEAYSCLESEGLSLDLSTFGDLYRAAHSYMLSNYRNEYIYKNVVANKILLGTHNLNTSHMLQEFKVGNCKADILMLNGTSRVYEIKSEYDSFERLERQITAYSKAFDEIYVIVSDSQVSKALNFLPDFVGIHEFRRNGHISRPIRNAKSLKKNLDHDTIFNCLRKSEYTKILRNHFTNLPSVPNTEVYGIYKEIFRTMNIEVAHNEMVNILKKRGEAQVLKEFILNVPYELKAFALGSKLLKSEIPKFIQLLNTQL
jgi:hypothetical protein